tara:strand:+ start:556 stop:876 length:321 start_codon:yes stop_codon:yes gene_type:complete
MDGHVTIEKTPQEGIDESFPVITDSLGVYKLQGTLWEYHPASKLTSDLEGSICMFCQIDSGLYSMVHFNTGNRMCGAYRLNDMKVHSKQMAKDFIRYRGIVLMETI